MKNLIFIAVITIFLISANTIFGQRKSSTPAKRKLRLITKPVPEPKPVAEDWKEFETKSWKFKVTVPKEPSVSENTCNDGITAVKSTICQSDVNQIFYM